ncbi:hypothetical protein B0H17DRAFT_1056458 [Mycena rosella]|uniref:DUF202 domain-containing protein n=1 Tax=Mycena rosella TaxID=1033263 RepID=A0AAD7GLT6_MYCRO|nr:hypothetical protein B0H17DRAFT_1056458 [Mycena rosella]
MNHDSEDMVADGHSELEERMSISSSAALIRPPESSTVLSRLFRTMSQILDKRPPPNGSLAPPGSPNAESLAGNAREVPPRPTPTPLQSTLPPLISRFQPSLLLQNSGSVARDHLAAERTFLAYVRTSLVVASTGVALVQLFTISSNTTTDNKLAFIPTTRRIQAWARPLGATMVCFGLVILTLGTTRYFRIQTALTKGMFPVARITAAGVTFGLGTIITIVFAILLSAQS